MTDHTPKPRAPRWVWLIAGCLLFGTLMSLRTTCHSAGARAALASSAFIVLAISIKLIWRGKP